MEADILIMGGTIHTMDPAHPRASAVAIRDGRILAVGGEDLRELAGNHAQVVELEGRCVLPGLTDSHVHLAWFGLGLQQVDLTGVRSPEEMLDRVAERVHATPAGEWVLGRGWDQELWPDPRFPTAADLDRVAPHHSVALTAKSGHALVANSLALARAGVTAETVDPEGGRVVRDPSGRPTGLLLEAAMELVRSAIPGPSATAVAAALPAAFEQAWRVGLTGVHDMDDLVAFDALQRLHARGEQRLRVVKYLPADALDHALALHLRAGFGDDWLRIGGIKVFADGALGPRTAAMLAPYEGEPDNPGILTVEREELEEMACRAAAGGLPLAVHAIGDRANRMVLDVFDTVGADTEVAPDMRHRIEHVQLLHPDDMARLARLGVVASMQPLHATQDAPMADRYWGKRTATAYAWRSLLDAGTVLAFGSDCPVEDLNPFLGIHAAATRTRQDGYGGPQGWHPEQRISVEEAVRAYTWGAAYTAGSEDRLGSLSPGKWADLVVLDRDIFTCDPASIAETRVVGTMVGGRWVFGDWAIG
ncbi:MAG TPA: amidohydrolase [Anaerolineales bacterium]|nr:amidohydrolase [Anaerolineae bacterium]HIQ02139.1 amidohydrolase [Anaerolineales bacterium]